MEVARKLEPNTFAGPLVEGKLATRGLCLLRATGVSLDCCPSERPVTGRASASLGQSALRHVSARVGGAVTGRFRQVLG